MTTTAPPAIAYSRNEAAKLLGLCVRSLDAHRASGRIGSVKFGRGQRARGVFRPCDLDAFLARFAVPARADSMMGSR